MGLSNDQLKCTKSQMPKNVVLNVEEKNVGDEMGDESSSCSYQKKKNFNRSQHHFSPRDKRKKLYGFRHLRRIENLNILLSQVEGDEDESGEVDFVDLVSHQNSAFRELFVEPEKMSAWVAFVNSSEEEQEHILASSEKVKLRDIFDDLDNSSDFVLINQTDCQPVSHQSLAVTAHQCFQRINRNLRSFLRHSHFPDGELHRLEEELIAFFVEWPSSVYVANLPDGYRRMMLHAVSQYLDLNARSFDVPGRVMQRQTLVENSRNKGNTFVPPPTPLATYINNNKSLA